MNLTPYQEAQAVYLREESTTTFLAELALHLENPTAWVLKTPTMFCLAANHSASLGPSDKKFANT